MKKYLTILIAFCSFNSNAQKAFFSSHNSEVTRFVQSSLAATVITNGLIQNLDANNTSSYGGSGSTWTDVVGGNNGTIVGGTYTTSGGVSFFNFQTTVAPSYVSAPLAKSTSMTFNVWAKVNSTSVPGCMLFNTGFAGVGPDLFFSNGGIYWNIWDSYSTPFNNASTVVPTSIITNTNWHNYTVVVDQTANNVKLYFDGVWMGTSTYRPPNTSTNLFIGSAGQNSSLVNDLSWNWIGGISVFQSYNRALNATEVTNNFNALKSRFGY